MNRYQRIVNKIAKKWTNMNSNDTFRFSRFLARQYLKRDLKQYRDKINRSKNKY